MNVRKNAEDVSCALIAGERWRSDLRAASGRVALERGVDNEQLVLANSEKVVAYQFVSNAVWRRVGSGNWICAVTNVKSSAMIGDTRGAVAAWRWELELAPRTKRVGNFRPLFTFLAVPERSLTK
jgi:hypothetical protein